MDNPTVSGGALSGWAIHKASIGPCNAYNKNKGGVVRVASTGSYNPAIYQTVSVSVGQIYTWSCDLYDYDYGQLDAVNGANPLVTSFPGFPIKVPSHSWKTVKGNFTATSTTATVTVFGNLVCARNCSLVPVSCGTPAPTPMPILAPVLALQQSLSGTISVSVTSSNTAPYTTRCVIAGTAYTNIATFWSLTTSSAVIQTSSLPFVFSFIGLTSNTAFVVGCSCDNGGRSNIVNLNVSTIPMCKDNIGCPVASKCVDTANGTRAMCAPYFDGARITGSPPVCRHLGGTNLFTNLTSTAGGDNITVCLVIGNNTDTSSFSSTVQLYYGLGNILMPCLGAKFSTVSGSYLTATCITSPGVGRSLNFSLMFNTTNNAVGPVQVTGPDSLSYPMPVIFPNTSRFFYQPGNWTNVLVAPNSDPITIAFNVANIAPKSPLFRVFYGPDSAPNQKECSIDRVQTNYTTVVCLTDPTTSYSTNPYKWTVVAGDVNVTGTDTFNLAATFPRVTGASATGCAINGNTVYNCPPVGSVSGALVTLTVFGDNFGNNASVRVFVDGVLCPFLSLPNSSIITCSLPPGTGYNRNVFVQSGSQYSSPLPLVSYSGPTITRLCGCDTPCSRFALEISNCPRNDSTTLDVYGTSFGLQGASVLVGSSTCSSVIHDSFSPDTHLSCTLTGGYSVHSSVIVIQQNGPNSAGGAVAELSFALCPPGTIQNGVLIQCMDCPPGTYAPLSGQIECIECAPGSFANLTRQTSCLNCPVGMSQPMTNQTSCVQCSAGTFSGTDGLSSCIDCAPGTYINTTGATVCTACEKGFVSGLGQATSCDPCSPGQFSGAQGQSRCDSCTSGSISNTTGAVDCIRCAKGQFMAIIGQSICKSCELGWYADSLGSVVCTSCPSGKISAPDSSGCNVCNPGTYQSSTGKSNCSLCPTGKYMDSQGATICLKCDSGMIAATEGMAKCTPCPLESTQNGDPPVCWCKPSYYMATNNTCVLCGEGMDCRSWGLVESALVASAGYIKVPNITLFVRCLDASYCPGNLTTCAPFRTGALCNTCESGYRPVQGEGACGPCPQQKTSAGYVAVIAILLLIGLTLLYVFMLRTDMHLFAQIELKHRQWWHESDKDDVVDEGPRFSTTHEVQPPDKSPIVSMRAESRIKKTLSYQFKIFITFLQLATALLTLTNVNWPPSFQYFINGFDFINLNFLPWNYVGCITQFRLFDKIMLTAFFPPLFLLIIGGPLLAILWCLEKRDHSDKDDARVKRANAKSIFWRVIVFTMFLCYPSVSRQTITYFRCVGVPDGYTTTYYLLDSFSEQCYDEKWFNLLAPVILTLLLYPIGIPLALLWALVRFRSGFRDPNTLYSLGLVYSGYHPEFWWFEILDMCHKLALTCLVALFGTRSGQVISALVIAALYLLTLLLTMPYLRLFDNLFHMLSQAEIFLLILSMQCGGEVGSVLAGSVTDVLVSGVLIMMVVVVITAFVILIVRYLRLAYLRNVRKKRQLMELFVQTEKNSPQLGAAGLASQSEPVDDAEKAQEHLVRLPTRDISRGSMKP